MNEAFDPQLAAGLLSRVRESQGTLIQVLQAIQGHYRWLSPEALSWVSREMNQSPTEVFGVASFYNQFRFKPMGQHTIRVCQGTACHIQGAPEITEVFRERLKLLPGEDTDAQKLFTVEDVSCLGTCTLAPVVQVDGLTCGRVKTKDISEILNRALEATVAKAEDFTVLSPLDRGEIRVGSGSCCVTGGAREVQLALQRSATKKGIPLRVSGVSCVGMCHQTPLVEIRPPRGEPILYTKVSPDDVTALVEKHFPSPRLFQNYLAKLDSWFEGQSGDGAIKEPYSYGSADLAAFLKPQRRVTTEHGGEGDPLDLDGYLARGGFQALTRARTSGPEWVIQEIEASGLRGRGGAGFPTGKKWRAVAQQGPSLKTLVVNGDEGDPGAFMDRMILESHPFRVLEGVLIGALATGASEAIFYIREEYPLALTRIRAALEIIKNFRDGWGTQGLSIRVVPGAGAFVCGEETALLASLEGHRGMPVLRPPYPAEKGYLGRPTLINNVETWASVPWILAHGAKAFFEMGLGESRGTKVFSLTGKTRRGGLVEVPMGLTLKEIVEGIGGGVREGRSFKAVQIGGPSGACLPAALCSVPVDYESLKKLGAIMGSGGLVVMDDEDCMVDMARYFMTFTAKESCGRCTFCRVGTTRLLEILESLCAGSAKPVDVAELENLARGVMATSLCGLGRTAPNPILSILRYFKDEVEAHVAGRCPAGTCRDLRHYRVLSHCSGCTKCLQVCPADAIRGAPYEAHVIDTDPCTRCDSCRMVCPEGAITRVKEPGMATP